MTKEELLKYEPGTIRRTPKLYQAFQQIYREEFGGGCSSCAFNSTISKWRKELSNNNTNTFIMSNQNNTFKLKQFHPILMIPGTDKAISANSPDELVIEFLLQEDGKYFEQRKKTFFDKLPDGIDQDGNIVENADEIQKKGATKVKTAITKAKNSFAKKVEKAEGKDLKKLQDSITEKLKEFNDKDLYGNEDYLKESFQEVEKAFKDKLEQLTPSAPSKEESPKGGSKQTQEK